MSTSDSRRKELERAQLRDQGGKVLHTNLSETGVASIEAIRAVYHCTQRAAVEKALVEMANRIPRARRVAAILKQPRKRS